MYCHFIERQNRYSTLATLLLVLCFSFACNIEDTESQSSERTENQDTEWDAGETDDVSSDDGDMSSESDAEGNDTEVCQGVGCADASCSGDGCDCEDPRTNFEVCDEAAATCGPVEDICGNSIPCGGCGSGVCFENECVECELTEDCGDDEVCNDENQCVCSDSRSATEICDDAGADCDSVNDVCGESVTCAGCADGVCSENLCVGCTEDEECDSGLCHDNECVECVEDFDCGLGACGTTLCAQDDDPTTCQGEKTQSCTSYTCLDDNTCQTDVSQEVLSCLVPSCECPDGSSGSCSVSGDCICLVGPEPECTDDVDCASGICLDEECVECESDFDCGLGFCTGWSTCDQDISMSCQSTQTRTCTSVQCGLDNSCEQSSGVQERDCFVSSGTSCQCPGGSFSTCNSTGACMCLVQPDECQADGDCPGSEKCCELTSSPNYCEDPFAFCLVEQ